MKVLNVVDQTILDRSRHYAHELIVLCRPRGPLAERRGRDRITLNNAAKSLLRAIDALEAEKQGG